MVLLGDVTRFVEFSLDYPLVFLRSPGSQKSWEVLGNPWKSWEVLGSPGKFWEVRQTSVVRETEGF